MSRSCKWVNLVTAAAVLLLAGACEKPRKERLYFATLKGPIGFGHMKVVKDISLNPKTGGTVSVQAVVKPDDDRDELTTLMKSIYRQVKGRKALFRKHKGKLREMDIRFYSNEAKATAAGDDWLCRFSWSSGGEVKYENKQKLPLLKWAKKILGKSGKYKVLADADAISLDYTEPFAVAEGAKPDKLKYEVFGNDFIRTTDDLFTRIEQLKKLTYTRTHQDKVVAKIWLTRQQFTDMDLRGTLEREYNAVVGPLVQDLATGQMKEAKYIQIKTKQLRKTVRKLLGKLPKEQVELVKQLR